MRALLCGSIACLMVLCGNAQHKTYARYLIDRLCSEYCFGRGYTNDGGVRAAYFISGQLDSAGITPLAPAFFQEFPIRVNTFPGRLSLSINGKKLATGRDYQIAPESGAGKDRLRVKTADTTSALPLNDNNSITLLPAAWLNRMDGRKRFETIAVMASRGPLIIEAPDKLTWSVADVQFTYPVFEVKRPFLTGAKTVKYTVDAFINEDNHRNVAGVIRGTAQPDSFLVLTAHYDHLGGMGQKTYIEGANDNASGTAMLIELARYFRQHPLKYSVVVIAFAGEEAGLIGSKYFTEHPLVPLSNIKCLFNMDLMGTGKEGATVVNATEYPELFQKLLAANNAGNYLPVINQRGKAANSDHYWFSEKGVPSFFMYLLDSSYTAYHNIDDRAAGLPLTRFDETCKLIIDFFAGF